MSIQRILPLAALAGALALSAVAAPVRAAEIDCKLDYSITGWSVIYKHSNGYGRVYCSNGERMNVRIRARGVGLTAGKWHVNDGHGRFSDVYDIGQVLGKYAHAEAHAGVVKSGSAQVLTKGNVSLALAGHGEGFDLGVDIGQFVISRR